MKIFLLNVFIILIIFLKKRQQKKAKNIKITIILKNVVKIAIEKEIKTIKVVENVVWDENLIINNT